MPQYKYIAVTQDNQKMTGSLSAADENDARKELNELGLAILNIEETASTQQVQPIQTPPQQPVTEEPKQVKVFQEQPEKIEEPKGKEPDLTVALIKFEFEAHDKTGKKIIGTIPATDKMSALTRLTNEYKFDVSYISLHDTTQAEKDHDRQEGLENLKQQIKNIGEIERQDKENLTNDTEFIQKQKILLKKVDYVLEKIKEVLDKFGEEIRPENKKLIQGYIDKLLRIKNSTNLEYIEHTAEELLRKVQDQEIFLHKESLQKEKASLRIESQELLSSLRVSTIPKKAFSEDIQEKLAKVKFKPLQNFLRKIAEKTRANPEATSIKSLLSSTNRQLLIYLKIWAQTKGKDGKQQVTESIKTTWEERKKLKQQLSALKTKKHKPVIPKQPKPQDDTLASETVNFLGWLLSFYLIYYFVTYYFTQKDIPYTLAFPWDPHINQTPLLKYLVAILMLWYILLATKTKFASKTRFSTPVLSIIGIVTTALIVFNF